MMECLVGVPDLDRIQAHQIVCHHFPPILSQYAKFFSILPKQPLDLYISRRISKKFANCDHHIFASQSGTPFTMKQITIVGAGFSGSLTAVHLLRGAPIPLHIRLIEQAANQVAKGLAYNTTQTCHLLNVPAGSMSAFPDEPDHFLNWARANCRAETPWVPEISPTAFLPRAWYGLYLAQVLRDAITAAQGRHAIEILTDEVTSVTPSGEGYDVRTRLGAWWHTELCVLALGNFAQMRPADPPVCHRNPWAPDVLETLLKTRQCLLVGSGLTTLDLVVALRTNRYAGKIHIVSRRGLTPQRHRAYGQTAVLDHDALKGGNLRALVREVRQRIATQMDKGGDWRSVIDAMRPHSARLWLSLSLSDRRTFMRHVRPYWDNHRHRTAAPIDDIFRAAMTDGSILLHRARVTGYEVSATGGVTATLRGCGLPPRQLEVDRIVYCTGPEPDLQKLDVPLLRQLFAEGRVQTNPVGFGLATNASGALIDTTGQASPALFTIGPPMKGRLWETTAVPELRMQAMALAATLLKQLERLPAPH
ncbi:FAD/NAD(P)-binding protein [Achromobacter xylosoxidans]|uniref:FAD/NAD(P)-binding protein n=1 Tax=Alcaligenes xylosoxydans xylosoxydans TaxID=85698 RepID=UPI00122FAE04|nr:FAD/NAD(P)-binding protein [Achromobacter xylosoxidans]QEQ25959.1 hypothetical protein F0U64_28190 [Achromobacter xylosoxidans]